MANAYSTKIAEGFSQKLMKEFYDINLVDVIVNREYEGEINKIGSKLHINNIARITEKTYTRADMTADPLEENPLELLIDQYKSFYWAEYTLDKWLSFIKDPHQVVVKQKADERSRNVDLFVFGKYGDVAAGNRVGVVEASGTVTVDVSTGVVTGSGCAFTTAMIGRGFKADGHSVWYRVKSRSGNDAIIIEDDLDDVSSVYSGGAIGGGATYEIEAATVKSISTSNLLQNVSLLKEKLDIAERTSKSTVPDSGRWLIVPTEFETNLVRASGVALHVPEVYQGLVKKGFITEIGGFKVFKSNRLTGNNTDGFRIIAGHSGWMTFAEKLLKVGAEDLQGNFGDAYKDLFVYGAKVPDTRRHWAAEGFWKFV